MYSSYKLLSREEQEEVDGSFSRLLSKTDFSFQKHIVDDNSKFLIVQEHISRLLLNESDRSNANVFIKNYKPMFYMCNVLISTGITELQPEKGVVLCSCLTNAYIVNLSKHFYGGSEVSYRREHLDLFIEPFRLRLYDGNEEITTVFAPLNLNDNH